MAKRDIDTLPRKRLAIKRQKVTPKRSAAVSPDAGHRDLYAGLIRLHVKGFLRSAKERIGRTERRVYRATPAGRKALVATKTKVRELFGELFEDEEGDGS